MACLIHVRTGMKFGLSHEGTVGRDSVVGMGTRYGPGGKGMKSRWERDFVHPSRMVLMTIQPPTQWLPGLSRR